MKTGSKLPFYPIPTYLKEFSKSKPDTYSAIGREGGEDSLGCWVISHMVERGPWDLRGLRAN